MKVEKIRKETGNHRLKTEKSENRSSLKEFMQSSLFRPLKFLLTEPIVSFCAILCAISYGLIYGLTASLTIVYKSFGWSTANTSLSFLAILLGMVLDIIPRFYDQYIFKKYKRLHKTITPEAKIRSFAISCPALAIGHWIFAWTIPPAAPNIHWAVSMIGLVLIGFAANDFSYVLFGYLTDLYGPYAASAVSSLSLCRTLVGAAFPLFTTQIYEGLGANVATSILASVATMFMFTPILLLGFAGRMKKMSKYTVSVEDREGEDGQKIEMQVSNSSTSSQEEGAEYVNE